MLQKMQPKRKQAIVNKINAYARGERVDIKKLVGSDFFRIRVGQDRIILDDNGVIVFHRRVARARHLQVIEKNGDIQKITLDGKNYVLLSEDDFEDMVDGLKAQAVLARVQAGEETWPWEIVEARANAKTPFGFSQYAA